MSRVGLVGSLILAGLVGCEDCKSGSGRAEPTSDAGAAAPTGSSIGAAIDASSPTQGIPDGGTMNVTPVPTASVAAMVNPDKLPVYTGPTGSVEGTVTLVGKGPIATPADFSKCPDAAKTWGKNFREGKPDAKGARPLADAVVVATGYKGYVPETREAKAVRIDGCAYVARTATLTFGQRLEVKNVSKEFWTPLLEPGSKMVMMMATPNGDPARIYPKQPGHYLLLDRDRKYALVDVYAFLHPFHDATDLTGHYRIDGLPVGKLRIGAMHPQIDAAAETELVVTEGVVHRVDLVLKNEGRDAGVDAGLTDKSPVLH